MLGKDKRGGQGEEDNAGEAWEGNGKAMEGEGRKEEGGQTGETGSKKKNGFVFTSIQLSLNLHKI